MANTNYKKIFAIQNQNKMRWLKLNPELNEFSGIYILTRTNEGNERFAYIGQAVNILNRLASHLSGYDMHIDTSLKKHKLYSDKNVYGWNVEFFNCDKCDLDSKEREFIELYKNAGFELRNKTGGGQDKGKVVFEMKERKGYRSGVDTGYNNAVKEIAGHFKKIDYSLCARKTKQGTANASSLKALEKIQKLLEL